MSTISASQIAQFNNDGFLILPSVFTTGEVDLMRREADRILDLAIRSSIATGEWNARIDLTQRNGRLDFRKLQPVNDLSAAIRQASGDERLVGPLRQLMGEEPILMEEKLNFKQTLDCPEFVEMFRPPVGDDRFPLHHDWGYYRANGYPRSILSSAICLDDCTPDNGPLRVIPGSHKGDYPLKHADAGSGNGEVADGLFADDDRVDMVAPAGSVLLFHSLLLHDSKPNLTGQPRRVMIYSHYPGNYDFPEDARNRRGRQEGQRVEKAYRALVSVGA